MKNLPEASELLKIARETLVKQILPGATGDATGTCRPSNPQGGDIHILYSIPHMHKAGAHMKTVINRPGGPEILVDKPFKFDEQRSYDTPAVVKRGETLTTTCTFNNTTNAARPICVTGATRRLGILAVLRSYKCISEPITIAAPTSTYGRLSAPRSLMAFDRVIGLMML